jgi:hypothetical protein
MRKIKSFLVVLVSIVFIGGAAIFGTMPTFAKNNTQKTTLAQYVARNFKIDVDDVKSVIDKYSQDRKVQTEADIKSSLNRNAKDEEEMIGIQENI